MSDLETMFPDPKTGAKRAAIWRDKAGLTHRAVGAQQIASNRNTFIMWTACGKKDVPGGKSWLQNVGDDVNCDACLEASP